MVTHPESLEFEGDFGSEPGTPSEMPLNQEGTTGLPTPRRILRRYSNF